MDSQDRQVKLNYYKEYYRNHYKDIIKDKKDFCNACNCVVAKWNVYKHNKSKKHQFNLLSEDEKKELLAKQQFKNKDDKTKEELLQDALNKKRKLEERLKRLNKKIELI